MSKVAQLETLLRPETLADGIAGMWDRWWKELSKKREEWLEVRNYVFATDTTKTSNASLPWRNKTTIPKLCQIRDNLHTNYESTLFPNDNWMQWQGYDDDSDTFRKKQVIQAYMSNKVREGNLRDVASKGLLDFIDSGNTFFDTMFVKDSHTAEDGEVVPGYVGPKLVRISPNDIVFDPTAPSFEESPKITRCMKSLGDLILDIESHPQDSGWLQEAIPILKERRANAVSWSVEDFHKSAAYSIDGFGNLQEYFKSGNVELLEFEGSLYDPATDKVLKNYIITVADRSVVVRKEPLPSWHGRSTKVHISWRDRPDNLWGMGPLDNLVGMQYRIDHLENMKADAWDMIAFPMPKIIGEVEPFEIRPGGEIQVIDGDVTFLSPDATFLQADTLVAILEQKMEDMAGAPRTALGIRTPGEKTAFEVGTLSEAGARVFQSKVTKFEMGLEKCLNNMLESARRNMQGEDVARVVDPDIGVAEFITITKADITAKGKLRPIGARHFAAQQRLMQDLNNLYSSPLGQMLSPHTSSKKLAQLVNDVLQLDRYGVIKENVAVIEAQEQQRLAGQAQEDLLVEQSLELEAE